MLLIQKAPRRAAAIGAAATGLLACGQAAAQAPPSSGGGRDLQFTATGKATYDSNVAQGNDQSAQVRNIQPSDIVYAADATAAFSTPIGRQVLGLNAAAGYSYYQNNTKLNGERLSAAASYGGALGRCSVGISGNYGRQRSSLNDLTILTTRNIEQSIGIAASETCAAPAGIIETISIHQSYLKNSAIATVDSNSYGANLALGYNNKAIGSLSLTLSYEKSSYDDTGLGLGQANGFELSAVGFQFARPLGSRLSGVIGVSYNHTKAKDSLAGSDDNSGLGVNTSIAYRASERLSASLDYSRTSEATLRQGASYVLAQGVNLNVNYRLSSRLSTSFGAGWSRDEQRGMILSTALLAPTKTERLSATASVSLQLGRKLSIAADVGYNESNTDLALFDYSSEHVGISLSTAF